MTPATHKHNSIRCIQLDLVLIIYTDTRQELGSDTNFVRQLACYSACKLGESIWGQAQILGGRGPKPPPP